LEVVFAHWPSVLVRGEGWYISATRQIAQLVCLFLAC
jgi:hypothetical protein